MGNLGALYLQLGRRERAESLLKRAAEGDPQRAEWWGNLGLLYSAQGQFEQAEKVIREAVARSPGTATWHVQLVDLLLRLEKVELAWQAVYKGIQHHPSHGGLLKRAQAIARTVQKGER
jgi:Tfp pilus assembly protein PilF